MPFKSETQSVIKFTVALLMYNVAASHAAIYLGYADGKSFFADNSTDTNWTQAKQVCENSRMHLASMNTVAQYDVINSSLKVLNNTQGFWVDARDSQTVSRFVWDKDNSTLDSSVIPLDSIPEIKTCLFLFRQGGNDRVVFRPASCSESWHVICEI